MATTPTSTATTVKLENRTARIISISLGGGDFVTVPPIDPPAPVEITLATDADKARLERALATPIVKAWIEAGELVVGGGGAGTPTTPPPTPPSTYEPPEHSKHRR